MRKTILLLCVAVATMLSTSVNAQNAWGLAGSGTKADPYQVTSAADFAALANNISAENKGTGEYFKLMNDVDFGGTAENPVEYPNIGKTGVSSLINVNYGFDGTFDGNNKTISGIYATNNAKNTNGYWNALFCAVDTNGVVKNVVMGKNNHLVGYTYTSSIVSINRGLVQGCTNYADMTNENSYAAGICGFLLNGLGSVVDCTNYGNITSKTYACGVVGGSQNIFGDVTYTTRVSGNVNHGKMLSTAGTGASGIMGMFCGGELTNNTNNGEIDGSATNGSYAAGIVSSLYKFNDNMCYGNVNNGKVAGYKYVGGVFAYVMRTTLTSIVITNQTNNGAVSGNVNTAGIVGSTIMAQDVVLIDGCTNNGAVECNDEATGGNLRGNALIALGDNNVIGKGLKRYDLDPIATAIDDVKVEKLAKAHKYIMNGQLVIEMDGVKYNAAGQVIK